jgi:hypothetical protein
MAYENKPLYMLNHWGEQIDAEKPTYAPDGYICGAWRKVRKNGRIKHGVAWRQTEKLLPYIGMWIWCEVGDYWNSETNCWHARPGMRQGDVMDNFICTIKD